MKVYIIGAHGNMARRYQTILHHLGHETWGADLTGIGYGSDLDEQVHSEASSSDAVIIATPTSTHSTVLRLIADCDRPILCEKPVTKSLDELSELIDELKFNGTRLEMVSQYDHIKFPREGMGPTFYDYWKSGGDGLAWDCINIVYHANGPVTLRNESPIWRCMINGHALSIADMDQAYVDMIDHWLRDPRDDLGRIWEAHKKVADLEATLAR